jgi:NAD+ diphosphatase
MTPENLAFANAPFDRAAHHRTDEAWLEAAFASNKAKTCLLMAGRPLVAGGWAGAPLRPGEPLPKGKQHLVWLSADEARSLSDCPRLFLGKTAEGAPIFALNAADGFDLEDSLLAGRGVFGDMRAAVANIPASDTQLAATARSIFAWHRRHGFCANCGRPTKIVDAGWKRACPACDAEHFPRVDPVAIMLAVSGDKCLIGRQDSWPSGMYSCLAGFIEPGETPEQGAARELFEEAGVRTTGQAEYLFCQPWPYPFSLMIGLILETASEDIAVDKTEIDEAIWITRAEALAAINGEHPKIFVPPPLAIAHHILRAWAERG